MGKMFMGIIPASSSDQNLHCAHLEVSSQEFTPVLGLAVLRAGHRGSGRGRKLVATPFVLFFLTTSFSPLEFGHSQAPFVLMQREK